VQNDSSVMKTQAAGFAENKPVEPDPVNTGGGI
jgi:hypothetical protein